MRQHLLTWSTVAALLTLTKATLATAASNNTSTPPSLEVDVLYPQAGNVYGYDQTTDWIPVVYVLQNVRDAVQHADIIVQLALEGNFPRFVMTLWTEHITQVNVDQYSHADGSPFLLIKSINVNDIYGTNSDWTGSIIDQNWYTNLSLVSWLDYAEVGCTGDACAACQNTPFSKHDFQIYWQLADYVEFDSPIEDQQPNQPSPLPINAMPNVTDACANPAIVVGANPNATAMCQMFSGLPLASASPCAVTLDAQAVSSVSSVAASIAAASPTPTEFAIPTWSDPFTMTPSRAHAMATAVLAQLPLLAAAAVGILGGAGLHFG